MLHWKIRLRTTVKKNILDKKEREKKKYNTTYKKSKKIKERTKASGS